jgi:hypothetical protein
VTRWFMKTWHVRRAVESLPKRLTDDTGGNQPHLPWLIQTCSTRVQAPSCQVAAHTISATLGHAVMRQDERRGEREREREISLAHFTRENHLKRGQREDFVKLTWVHLVAVWTWVHVGPCGCIGGTVKMDPGSCIPLP